MKTPNVEMTSERIIATVLLVSRKEMMALLVLISTSVSSQMLVQLTANVSTILAGFNVNVILVIKVKVMASVLILMNVSMSCTPVTRMRFASIQKAVLNVIVSMVT